MIMIIACHILQGQGSFLAFWFNLGVQIFFFMSGFLYGGKPDNYITNKRKWYSKQFSKILAPYLLLVIIMIIIKPILTGSSYPIKEIILSLSATQGIIGGGIPQLTHTWFISYILLCYLITPFLSSIQVRNLTGRRFLIGLIITALAFCFADYFNIFGFNAAWIFNYLLGFYFARFYTSQQKNYQTFRIWIYTLAIVSVIIKLAVSAGITPAFSANTSSIISSWTHVAIGSALFILLYDLLNKLNLKYTNFIKFCDTYSYHIYLVHQVFILGTFSIISLIPFTLLGIALAIAVSIIAGANLYYLTWFLQTYNPILLLKNKLIRKDSMTVIEQ